MIQPPHLPPAHALLLGMPAAAYGILIIIGRVLHPTEELPDPRNGNKDSLRTCSFVTEQSIDR
jgi:hypothetical protein